MVPKDELDGYFPGSLWRKLLVPALVVVAVLAGGYFALRPAPEKPVPEFSLPRLDERTTLSSDSLKGHPVVLNFFASWCDPCQEEAGLLERSYLRYRDRGVRFVGVNIKDTPVNARRFAEEFGITFPIVRDAEEKLAGALDVYGLPQTFFIDANWELSSVTAGEELESQGGTPYLGAISRAELEEGIETMLGDAG